jgi:hypothetical protein
MSPHDTADDTTIAWVEGLRDDSEPATELVPIWTQSAWDRRKVHQLQAVQDTISHLAGAEGTPDSVLVREALLHLGYDRAAHEHMETTRHEDERSFFAALCREYDARVIEPTAVHMPGRRRKPVQRRGEGGRFLPKGSTS